MINLKKSIFLTYLRKTTLQSLWKKMNISFWSNLNITSSLTWQESTFFVRRLEVFYKIEALKNYAKSTGKQLCQSLLLTKVAGWRWHRCFPVNFAKFLRTLFLTEHLQWPPLQLVSLWMYILKNISDKIYPTENISVVYPLFGEYLHTTYWRH